MRTSIIYSGKRLPESEEAFKQLAADKALTFTGCHACKQEFNASNTKTKAGWRETQISGFCETCYDKTFAD